MPLKIPTDVDIRGTSERGGSEALRLDARTFYDVV